MDNNLLNPNKLSTQLCDRFKISNNESKEDIMNLFSMLDLNNYYNIKGIARNISNILNNTNKTEVLSVISNILGYKNHHNMKSKMISRMLESNEAIIQNINNSFKTFGLKGLLPHNLSDEILYQLSIEHQSFQQKSKDIGFVGLLLIIGLFSINADLNVQNNQLLELTMNLDELNSRLNLYGIQLSLESLRRADIISIPEDMLVNENNIFDEHAKICVIPNFSHPVVSKALDN